MMRYMSATLLGLAVIGFCSVGEAATAPVRVRGEITAVHGGTLEISTYDGKRVDMTLAPHTRFVSVVRASLSDIKAGDFVGIGATGPESRLTALEVVIFPESMRGTGEGHYAWSVPAKVAAADQHRSVANTAASAPPVQGTMTNGTVAVAKAASSAPPVSGTMTNGTVSAKAGKSGVEELAVSYKDGEVHILVPADAPVVRLAIADRSIVTEGAKAFAIGSRTASSGPLEARVVAVGKNGLMPPM